MAHAAAPPAAPAPGKPGGILNLLQREELTTGFSIHETATIATVWPASPCYSNLVIFDPFKPRETLEGIVGELAEKWSWQDNYRNLVFFLRRDVKWHDGAPFTSKDVKYTFDMVREAPEQPARLRLNPRKDWYVNVEAIEAPDPTTVVFRLKRPQPSLLSMLASGQSPVYPAHVPAAEMRNRCVGTGPFKLKEWRRGEMVEYVRNPDYFEKGRPVPRRPALLHRERSRPPGRRAAGRAGGRVVPRRYHAVHRRAAEGGGAPAGQHRGRQQHLAESAGQRHAAALQRRARAAGAQPRDGPARVHPGRAPGRRRDGRRHAVAAARHLGAERARARAPARLRQGGRRAGQGPKRLLTEAGFSAANPLKLEIHTRAIASYLDFAAFVVSELKRVGVEATLKQVDTVQWYAVTTRKEYQLGANVSGFGIDDPDAIFYENYGCSSIRNYTGYCNELVSKLIDQQSQELDAKKRLALVRQILIKLEEDGARPTMGWSLDAFTHWPQVRNLVPHHGIYNWGRLTHVWLDK